MFKTRRIFNVDMEEYTEDNHRFLSYGFLLGETLRLLNSHVV